MEPAAQPESPSVRLGRREGRSSRDMILSLAVLLVPIALFIGFYRVVLGGDTPVSIDPAPAIQEATSAAVFPVLRPGNLGEDWHVTSANFRRQDSGATLRIGYVDPDDDSVQLLESSVAAETLIPAELGATAKITGDFRSPAGPWRRYDARPGETALVLSGGGRTVIVVGRTDPANLEKLATSLS